MPAARTPRSDVLVFDRTLGSLRAPGQPSDREETTPAHVETHHGSGDDALRLHELGAPTGPVNFAQQQAQGFRVENRTSDPVSPAVGQVWLRTDL